jgi:hypothetical protein
MSQTANQNLRLFQNKFKLDSGCVDLDLDDLQFRKLRLADIGARVLLQCKLSKEQQQHAQVSDAKPAVSLKKKYAQLLGPGVHLENVEILECGDGKEVSEQGTAISAGDEVVLSATVIPQHGWGRAVGYREES